MKKLIMMLLVMLLMSSCRSRSKQVAISEYRSAEVERIDTNIVVSQEKKLHDLQQSVKKSEQQEKKNEGDLEIRGKTDSTNDFHFHNVVAGDTLADIYIKGNADFVIRNRWQNNSRKESSEQSSESLNIVAEIARKVVAQSTIKEVAEEIKTKEVQVKSSGFVWPVWIIIGAGALLGIVLFFAWRKFGGGIMEFFNKKR